MIVRKISSLTGKVHSMNIDVTQEQIDSYFDGTEPIQVVFPWLSPEEREFINTGITPEEWNTLVLGDKD